MRQFVTNFPNCYYISNGDDKVRLRDFYSTPCGGTAEPVIINCPNAIVPYLSRMSLVNHGKTRKHAHKNARALAYVRKK